LEPAVYFISRERREEEGAGGALILSIVLHSLLIIFLFVKQTAPKPVEEPPLRYVDIVEQQPEAVPVPITPPGQQQSAPPNRQHLEAPGPEVGQAPPDAPLSNANRRATIPSPTGDQPTNRPGVGGTFVPGAQGPPAEPSPASETRGQERDAQQREREERGTNGEVGESSPGEGALQYEVRRESSNEDPINWKQAIEGAGRPQIDPGAFGAIGGDKGFAESGPISFETQWYPWGDYADQMIGKIRYHWYSNMPPLIRLGVKGVVVLRFTIQRDGRITDIQILRSSGSPPYDFAARKAIELSSPLKPLPADFPNPNERVTAGFYYNESPPR